MFIFNCFYLYTHLIESFSRKQKNYIFAIIYFAFQKITVQCLLITDGENTFTVMNYIDVDLNPNTKQHISMGYRYKQFFENNMFSLEKGASRMSKNLGNRGRISCCRSSWYKLRLLSCLHWISWSWMKKTQPFLL